MTFETNNSALSHKLELGGVYQLTEFNRKQLRIPIKERGKKRIPVKINKTPVFIRETP